MKAKEKQSRLLKMESVLIELMQREGWSSAVQAERLFEIAHGKSTETIKKPWEHFSIMR